MKKLRIVDIRPTTVTVPVEAPFRHSNGCHWDRFVRTIVEVGTDQGVVGLGELGGYPYDRDPGRPGWFPLVPNDRWADPTDTAIPDMRAAE